MYMPNNRFFCHRHWVQRYELELKRRNSELQTYLAVRRGWHGIKSHRCFNSFRYIVSKNFWKFLLPSWFYSDMLFSYEKLIRHNRLFSYYFLILFEVFGRARIWILRHAHTPCPPTAHQSSSELLLGGVYPDTGGLSGNWLMKSPRAPLKGSREVILLTFFGSRFHRRATLKELSYAVEYNFWAL